VMKSMRETASVVALGSATAPEEHDAVKAALGPSTEWGQAAIAVSEPSLPLSVHRPAPHCTSRKTRVGIHRQTAPGSRGLQSLAQPSHCHAVRPRSIPHWRA
jgi:hypothetical protein